MEATNDQVDALRRQVADLQGQLESLCDALGKPNVAPDNRHPPLFDSLAESSHDAAAMAQMQKSLHKAGQFREAIINTVAEGICACFPVDDFPHIRFSLWNKRMEEITGYTVDEINRLGWYQTMYPDPETSRRAAARMERMRDGDHLQSEEWVITRKDGRQRTVAISTSFVETDEGAPAVAAMMQDVTARKEAEEELRQTLGLLQVVMDGAQDAIYVKDRQGRYLTINGAGARFLNKSIDDIVGKTDFDLFTRDTAEAITAVDKNILLDGCVQSVEERGDVGDEHHWYSTTKGPYRDKLGNVVGVIGISRDVTQRVKASQALKESQRENELLLQAIPDILMRVHRDGTYLSFKPPSGFSVWREEEQVAGRNVRGSIPPDTAEEVMSLIALALDTGVTQSLLATLPAGEGVIHRDVRIIPAAQDEVLLIIRDVTQRRNAEQQRDEYYRLTDAIRRIQSRYISHLSPSETYDAVLKELLSLSDSEYGFIGETLLGADSAPYLHTLAITNIAWDEATRALYEQTAEQGMEFHNLDTLFGHVLRTQRVVIANDPTNDARRGGLPPGHPPLTAFLGVPLTHDGEMIGMAGMANRPGGYDASLLNYLQPFLASCATMLSADVQQRRRQDAEQRLSQQQAKLAHVSRLTTLGEMLAGIAHEITQPLGAINNYAGAVATQLESGRPNQALDLGDWSRKISEQASRAGKIIERLRNFARRGEPKLREVALEEVIDEVIDLVQPYVRKHRAHVIWQKPQAPCRITLDVLQIQQVVVNLINNACEAMAASADSRHEVRVELTFDDVGAMMAVADDGSGIASEAQSQIFEAFYTTKAEGLGMGLAICRAVVESHNGRIWCTPNPKRGTTFHISLPMNQTSTP